MNTHDNNQTAPTEKSASRASSSGFTRSLGIIFLGIVAMFICTPGKLTLTWREASLAVIMILNALYMTVTGKSPTAWFV